MHFQLACGKPARAALRRKARWARGGMGRPISLVSSCLGLRGSFPSRLQTNAGFPPHCQTWSKVDHFPGARGLGRRLGFEVWFHHFKWCFGVLSFIRSVWESGLTVDYHVDLRGTGGQGDSPSLAVWVCGSVLKAPLWMLNKVEVTTCWSQDNAPPWGFQKGLFWATPVAGSPG